MLAFRCLAVAVLFAAVFSVARCADDDPSAAVRPVSVQELSLLLRSGYTGDEVLKETAGRPLLAPLDAAAERALLDAGADARTIAALRAGRPVASTAEADAARQRQAAADQYRLDVWETNQARLREANQRSVQAKLDARHEQELRIVAAQFHNKLVVCRDGRVEPYDNAALAGKTIFLLYSASSQSDGCRKLTPQLVDFYRKFAPAHPEFELVMIPEERSAADVESAMKKDALPWAALAFDQKAQQPDLAALAEHGLPRLVLIDGAGHLLADSFQEGDKHCNAPRVLEALVDRTNPKPGTAAR